MCMCPSQRCPAIRHPWDGPVFTAQALSVPGILWLLVQAQLPSGAVSVCVVLGRQRFLVLEFGSRSSTVPAGSLDDARERVDGHQERIGLDHVLFCLLPM